MQLDPDDIPSLARLLAPGDPRAEARRIRDALARGELACADFRVDVRGGEVVAAVQVHPLGSARFIALIRAARPGARRAVDALLVEAALRADALDAAQLLLRIPEAWQDPRLADTLTAADFRRVGWRLTFRGDPTPAGAHPTSVQWRSVDPSTAEGLLVRVCAGDPLAPDDPADDLRWWVGKRGLITEVHVGTEHGADVCLGVVQVEPATGWCQVGYVGVVPEARGRGLGRAAHRHLRGRLVALGGTHWEAGCSEENGPMRRILTAIAAPVGRSCEWRRARPQRRAS